MHLMFAWIHRKITKVLLKRFWFKRDPDLYWRPSLKTKRNNIMQNYSDMSCVLAQAHVVQLMKSLISCIRCA